MVRRCVCVATLMLLCGGVMASCVLFSPSPTASPTASPVPPTPTPPPTVDPRLGGRVTLHLSQGLDRLSPLQLAEDVEAGWVTRLLYHGLTRLDDQLQPRPGLAESWAFSADGLVVTFTLRQNLRWSDGTPLTAEDVRFTWERLRRWEPRLGVQADLQEYVAAVTAPTSRTVAFILTRRLAPLLADVSFPVFPQHVWGIMTPGTFLQADLLSRPIVSGPFEVEEHRPGQALVLRRNPYYYGPAPFFDQLAFLVAPDPQVTEVALRRGDLDLAVIPRETLQSLEMLVPRRPLRLERFPMPQYTFVAFNLRPGFPMADVRLRQAWVYALDKEALVAGVTDGQGVALWSPILPPSWAYDSGLPRVDRDPDRARELLAEAGWEDLDGDGVVEQGGTPLRVRLFVRADAPDRVAICQQMAAQLGQVGFAVEVIPADFDSVIAAKLRPPYDFDALLMRWSGLSVDPDLFYLFHSSQAWQGVQDERENLYNIVGYSSVAADTLLLSGRDEYDLEERRLIYAQLQRLLAQDLPYYMLWSEPVYLVASAALTTPEGPPSLATPTFLWNVERWYMEPGE